MEPWMLLLVPVVLAAAITGLVLALVRPWKH